MWQPCHGPWWLCYSLWPQGSHPLPVSPRSHSSGGGPLLRLPSGAPVGWLRMGWVSAPTPSLTPWAGGSPGLCLLPAGSSSPLMASFCGHCPLLPGPASWSPDVAGPSVLGPRGDGGGEAAPCHPSPPSTLLPPGGGRGLGFTAHNGLCLAQWGRACTLQAQTSSRPRTQGASNTLTEHPGTVWL